MCFDQTGMTVAPINTPVYVDITNPVAADRIAAASPKNVWSASAAAVEQLPKIASVHAPTDIGL